MFYCDSALWDEAKGDFDERTTDDLDVDMSLYMKGHGEQTCQLYAPYFFPSILLDLRNRISDRFCN